MACGERLRRAARWPWLGLAGLALASCATSYPSPVGPGAVIQPAATPQPAPSAGAPGAGGTSAPLTGLPVSGAVAARPAVALVLGPHPAGLAAADVVFEELGSPVRYLAVYQSRPATAGPVASLLPTDVRTLAVLHPVLGYDGSPWPFVLAALRKAPITNAGYARHTSLYRRHPGGLTASVEALWAAGRRATAPPPVFEFRSPGGALASAGLLHFASVQISLPGQGTQHWLFDSRTDEWTLASGGPKVSVANLVIQLVTYKQLGGNGHKGVSEPGAQVIGTGRAEVFSGSAVGAAAGTAAQGTWSKPHAGDLTNYLDTAGYPMAFQPGPTWIILAPSTTHVITAGG